MTTFGGRWTREKLEILGRYLDAYTTVMKNQRFKLVYIDAFAGSGTWQPSSEYARADYGEYKELLKGSASLALDIRDRQFDRLIFIEQNRERSDELSLLSERHPTRDIDIIPCDANEVLPKICNSMDPFERAVVFLDPYATQVAWDTVEAIAQTQKIDCWALFPLMAISRMMPRDTRPDPKIEPKLNRVFGGSEHWQGIYHEKRQLSFLEDSPTHERASGVDQIAHRYRMRLESAFVRVAPTGRTLKNSTNSPLFELLFAVSNPRGAATAVRIADYILENW